MEKNYKSLYNLVPSGFYNPFLFSGMEYTIKRLIRAIDNREKIVIYGFGDMDSITGISLLLLVLKYFNADVEYYMPDRRNEKAGLNSNEVSEYIKFLGAKLIITVGWGTKYIYNNRLCDNLGVDIVVTDNYNYKPMNEKNIINPYVCDYPFKELSKTGVVYKLIHALYIYYGLKHIDKYLDLVMLGTIASKSRIIGENAIIVKSGIYKMAETNNNGIKALTKLYGVEKYDEVTVMQFINKIVPRINLMSKVDNSKITVELFTTNDEDRAIQIAKFLHRIIRKNVETVC